MKKPSLDKRTDLFSQSNFMAAWQLVVRSLKITILICNTCTHVRNRVSLSFFLLFIHIFKHNVNVKKCVVKFMDAEHIAYIKSFAKTTSPISRNAYTIIPRLSPQFVSFKRPNIFSCVHRRPAAAAWFGWQSTKMVPLCAQRSFFIIRPHNWASFDSRSPARL